MSSNIDQRIVEMKFDNKQFESGVSTTLSTLEKLKNALKLSDAGKGMDELSEKANKFSLGGIQTAVENVSNRFSALGIVAMTALENITNKAVDAGERIVKALTLDPVMSGFDEYELKMDSIKTILSNTNGKNSLEEIKDVLEGLNKYADDTIYNFGQMTNAMGKMTAQGVDLYDAEQAVRGLSNLAALVGSGTQEYTNAMQYGLVQALAMGELRLQDWKSFENANISSKVFRDELIKTADAMGYFNKTWYDNQGSGIVGIQLMEEASEHFRETLKYGWVDNDVLLTTLSKFADTTTELGQKAQDAAREVRTVTKLKDALLEALQSGWANTWELIIGDVNEATKVLTKINDALSAIFTKAADERNAAFKKWHDSPINGRETFITAFEKIWDYFSKIATVFDTVKKNIFGTDALYKGLSKITEWLDNIAYSLEWDTTLSSKFYSIFKGALSIVDIILNGLSAWLRVLSPLLEPIGKVFGFIFDALAKIGAKISAFNHDVKAVDGYYKGLQYILSPLKKIWDWLERIYKFKVKRFDFKDALDSVATKLSELETRFKNFAQEHPKLVAAFDKIKIAIQPITDVLSKIIAWFKGLAEALGLIKSSDIEYFDGPITTTNKLLDESIEKFKELTSPGNVFAKIKDQIATNVKDGISWFEKLTGLKISLPKINEKELKKSFETLKIKVKGYFNNLSNNETFASLKSSIETTFGNVFDKINELLANANLQEKLDKIGKWFQKFIDDITTGFKNFDFAGMMDSILDKIDKFFKFINLPTEEKLATITELFGKLADSIKAFFGLFGAKTAVSASTLYDEDVVEETEGFTGVLEKLKEKGLPVLEDLAASLTDFEKLKKIGLVGLLFSFVKVIRNISKIFGNAAKVTKGFTGLGDAIADALGGIGGAIKSFRRKNNATAVLEIAAAIGILCGALVLVGNNLTLEQAKTAAGIVFAVAGALGVVFEAFARLKEASIGSAQVKVADSLSKFLNKIDGAVKKFLKRTSLAALAIGIAAAVGILAGAVTKLSKLSWNEAFKGVIILGVILSEMSQAIKSVTKGKNKISIGKAATVLAIALAVKSIASTLRKLAKIPLDDALPAMLMLAEIFGGMSVMMIASEGVTEHWGSLMMMSLIIGEIGLIIGGLSLFDQSKIQSVTLCLDSLMVCFGILEAASGGLTTAKGSLVLMGALLGEMAIILWKLSDLPVEETLGTATALSELILALSGAVTLLTMSGSWGIGAAAAGLLELDMFIVNLGALFTSIGLLIDQFPEIEYFIDKGIPIVKKLGKGLGQFFGSIVDGVVEGFSDSLPKLGKNLTSFSNKASGFFDAMSSLGDNGNFGNAVKMMADFVAIVPTTGGLFEIITGTKDISGFASGIEDFGEAIKNYASSIVGIDVGMVKKSAIAAQSLAKLNDSLPETGGRLQKWLGEKDLEGFGTKLVSFATGLKGYNDTISDGNGISTTLITDSTTAASALSELADGLSRSGGTFQDLFGEKSLENFGNGLSEFAGYLKDYQEKIETIDFNKLSEVMPFLNDMIDITDKANNVTISGGGLNAIDAALQQITIIAASCVDTLYDALVNDKTNTNRMTEAGEAIGNAITDGITKAIDNYKNNEISGKASDIVGEFVKSVKNSTEDNNNVTVAKSNFANLINSALSEVTTTINGFDTELTNAINGLFSAALAKIDTQTIYESTKNAGTNFAIGFANGIIENAKYAENAASTMGSNAVTVLNNAIQSASPSKLTTRSGEYFGQGFINGMESLMGKIALTSGEMGTEAIECLTSPLQMLDKEFDMDLNTNPVITPVIDMSNVEGGIGRINAMAGQTNLLFKGISADSINGVGKISTDYTSGFDDLHNDIDGLSKLMRDSMQESGNSMALLRDDINSFATNMQTSLNENGSGVNLLRDDMNRFASDMQSTLSNADSSAILKDITTLMNKYFPEFASGQIVLDSGAVVGELTPMFDSRMRKIVNRGR